jgi:hypothetical protein
MTKTVVVELKNTWFAPTSEWKKSPLQQMSGRRFKKGIYTWPEAVVPHLPASAKVGVQEEEVENPFDGQGFGGFVGDDLDEMYNEDLARAAVSAEQAIEDQAARADKLTAKSPEQILEERKANLAKANAASAVKRAAAKAEKEGAAAKAEPAASEGPSEILVEEDGDTVEF